jgi:arylsulfatase A-like enzyme
MPRPALMITTFAVLIGAEAAHADDPPAPRLPNIVFIMADDLGYGDLGCYGQEQIQTPRIDRLAEEGIRFTDYYAGSTVCAPSRCVLMTGYHTGHCYIRGNKRVNLRIGDVTVAEVLRKAGYKTGLFGKWGLGQENTGGVPIVQGFDQFYGYIDQHHAHNYFPAFLIKGKERVPLTNVVPGEGDYGSGVATEKNEYSHDLIFAEALQFVRDMRESPFFLYLAVTLPHANNEAGDEGMEITGHGDYADKDWPEPQKGLAAMITRLDSDVGSLMDLLKELKLDEHTIVFFTSDNGPHKEGGNDFEFFNSNGPLRGKKRDLYEGGIRVPLIARWPGRIAAGSVTDHVGYHGDLMATAAELANGAFYPPGMDSASLVPVLTGSTESVPAHEYLYWEFYEGRFAQAVRQQNWKAVRYLQDNATTELYDLATDIGEEHNVAAEHASVASRLAELMDAAHVPNPHWDPKPAPEPRD